MGVHDTRAAAVAPSVDPAVNPAARAAVDAGDAVVRVEVGSPPLKPVTPLKPANGAAAPVPEPPVSRARQFVRRCRRALTLVTLAGAILSILYTVVPPLWASMWTRHDQQVTAAKTVRELQTDQRDTIERVEGLRTEVSAMQGEWRSDQRHIREDIRELKDDAKAMASTLNQVLGEIRKR